MKPDLHRARDGRGRFGDLGVGREARAAVREEGGRVEQRLAAGLRAALKFFFSILSIL